MVIERQPIWTPNAKYPRCGCPDRAAWRVTVYRANYSAFNGYRRTPSDYSEVRCDRDLGGCGARWRTNAKYVETLLTKDGRSVGRALGRRP